MSKVTFFEHDKLAIDTAVRRGLGVGRGQSINEVADRIVASGVESPALHAARVLRSEKRPVWDAMAIAARILGWNGAAS